MTALRQSLILFLLLLLVTTGAALAQVLEVGGGFGANRVTNAVLLEDTTTSPSTVVAQVNNGWRMGFRMTINTQSHFGHEAGYSYVRTSLDVQGVTYGTAAHQGFYDFLVYATPEGKKVRPFVAGGAQFTNFIPPGGSVSQGNGTMKFGVNFGGGVKVKVTDKWLMRVDFRQYLSPKPDFFQSTIAPQGWIRMNEISMGVAYCL
jgi:opacity protein-like surface antigen